MKFLFIRFTLLLLVFVGIVSQLKSQNCNKKFTIEKELVLPRCQNDGEIIIKDVTGGKPPYLFLLGSREDSSGIFTDLGANTYELIVIDADSCKDFFQIDLVPKPEQLHFNVPNAFSPNGDGINDTWKIRGIDNYEAVSVSIYNKWGQELFHTPDYSNNFAWKGTQGSTRLLEGTYYYVISVFVECKDINQSGSVTILR